MYVNFLNAPSILDQNGKVEPSVSEWSMFLLNDRSFSRNTVDNYVNSLNLFYDYLGFYGKDVVNSFVELDKVIFEFRKSMRDGDPNLNWKPHSISSVNRALSALDSYLKYSGFHDISKSENVLSRFAEANRKTQAFLGYLKPSKIFKISHPRTKKKYALSTRHEPKRVKYFPPELFWDLIDLAPTHRDKALYLLMAGTSARIGQALNLWQRDILFDEDRVEFVDPRSEERRKEIKEKYKLISDDNIQNKGSLPGVWLPNLKEAFFSEARLYFDREYIPIGQRAEPQPYFFITGSGKRLSPGQVRQQFRSIASKLGSSLSPHSLRHLYGYVSAVMLNIRLEILMDNMGHASIESTKAYVKIPSHVAEQKFREALNKLLDSNPDSFSKSHQDNLIMLRSGQKGAADA